jgi:hypothetical protein
MFKPEIAVLSPPTAAGDGRSTAFPKIAALHSSA